ncbi:MAG: hypothetical protein K0Q52_131 [Microbacterium sp.]|jgi:uncharacterized membrane protein YgcG|nr:hypothetical protein [Microbacterium sp.]
MSDEVEPITPAPGAIIPVEPPPAPQRQWVLIATVAISLIASIVLSAGWISNLSSRNQQLNELVLEQRQEIFASQENAQRLYDQLLELGAAPDGEAPESIASPGPAGARGEQGNAGRPPTPAEIAKAVGDYCDARDSCRGQAGSNGSAGSVGPAGPAGSSGSDGSNGADGAPGGPGPEGPPGPAGPQGPAGPSCPEGYSLQIVTVQVQNTETGESSPTPAAVCLPA